MMFSIFTKFLFRSFFRYNLKLHLKTLRIRKISLSASPQSKECTKVKTAGEAIDEQLLQPIGDASPIKQLNKITIVGAGHVGVACGICILAQNVADEVCLIDNDKKMVKGQIRDFQGTASFLNNPKITGGTDFCDSACSRICILMASVPPADGQKHIDVLAENAKVFKKSIPKLIKYSPNTIFVIIGNPCDALTYLTWRISGLPMTHIIGTGTSLYTSRFRYFLSQRLGVTAKNCNCWIIGEHGLGALPVWSTANVAGVRLRQLNTKIGLPDDPENYHKILSKVIKGATEVNELKGHSTWAIALSATHIIKSILYNTNAIECVSTSVCGMYGIEEDVFLSLPCRLNKDGIASVLNLTISQFEKDHLVKTIENLSKIQQSLKL